MNTFRCALWNEAGLNSRKVKRGKEPSTVGSSHCCDEVTERANWP